MVIQCYRGENPLQEDNELLGTLVLDEIPPGARGEAIIDVTFRIDPDCILHVRARDHSSDQEVEAKLNVIGAPVAQEDANEAEPNHPEPMDDKESAKTRKKAEKERAKLEKKRKKADAKRAETSDQGAENVDKAD